MVINQVYSWREQMRKDIQDKKVKEEKPLNRHEDCKIRCTYSIVCRIQWAKDGQPDNPTTYINRKVDFRNIQGINLSESGPNSRGYGCIYCGNASFIFLILWELSQSQTYYHGQLRLMGSYTFILFLCSTYTCCFETLVYL